MHPADDIAPPNIYWDRLDDELEASMMSYSEKKSWEVSL